MGRPAIDLTGMKFGKLTVLERLYDPKNTKAAKWICICECGNKIVTEGGHLRRGNSKTCGCTRQETRKKLLTTHGMTNTRIYRIWHSMISRCKYKGTNGYELYGGRGIDICKEWAESFEVFYDWAVKNGYKEELTLDRINANGNYEPNNCRWAGLDTQNNNRRSNKIITINGESKTIAEWSKETGVKYETIRSRISRSKIGTDIIKH